MMKNFINDYKSLILNPQLTFIKKHPVLMGVVMICAGVYGYWIGTKIQESNSFNFNFDIPEMETVDAEEREEGA